MVVGAESVSMGLGRYASTSMTSLSGFSTTGALLACVAVGAGAAGLGAEVLAAVDGGAGVDAAGFVTGAEGFAAPVPVALVPVGLVLS